MKIAILGCDGSHSEVYARLLVSRNTKDEVVLWDKDISNAYRKQCIVKSTRVSKELSHALDDAKLAMVVGRYASSHFEPAKAALSAGIPVYIDKPGLQTPAEVEQLRLLADELHLPLRCFSPLVKSAAFRAFKDRWVGGAHFIVASPAFCHAIFDEGAKDISFYASHATDLLVNLCGADIAEVRVTNWPGELWVDVAFKDMKRGMLYLPYKAEEFYKITAYRGKDVEIVSIDPWSSMYEDTLGFITSDFLSQGWLEDQFRATLNSAIIINEIRSQAGEFAWKR